MRDAEECYRLGTLSFAEIAWDWPDFSRVWAERATSAEACPPCADEFVRLACLQGRPRAVLVFERDYIAPLRAVVRRVCSDDDTTDVALQELRDKLLLPPTPRLESYRPSGSLRAWLGVVATRTALDVVRRNGVQARRDVMFEDKLEAMTTSAEEHVLSEELRGLIRAALRAAVKKLPDEQQHALRMHVISGWNIAQIGRVLSVHRATVARWLVAAKDALRVSTHQELSRLKGTPGGDAPAFDTFPSRLDLTLSSVFAASGVYEGASASDA